MFRYVVIGIILLGVISCESTTPYPKPKAQLALEYPKAKYHHYKNDLFEFEYNALANFKSTSTTSFGFYYPDLKASVYMYYLDLSEGIEKRIYDLEQKVADHQKMADEIVMHPFVNPKNNSVGALYEITGNTASQAQFYITDQQRHFIHGALYFNALPNYDSILPAANYIEEDISRFMESLFWK